MNKRDIGQRIVDVAYLRGEFLLRSGQTSDRYFDKYQFESEPKLLRAIAKEMAALIPEGTEVLAGLELGGVPIATALALETGIPTAFVRKERKKYGTCRISEGAELKGKRVCVIEDIITTGGQVVLSTKELRAEGAEVTTVCCAIYRGTGGCKPLEEIDLAVRPLFTMDELLSNASVK